MQRKIAAAGVMFIASLLVATLLREISALDPQWTPTFAGLTAAAVGGYIARTRFIPVALLVQALTWLLILYMLKSIGGGQSTSGSIASLNAIPMAVSFLAASFGAYLGQLLSARSRLQSVPAA